MFLPALMLKRLLADLRCPDLTVSKVNVNKVKNKTVTLVITIAALTGNCISSRGLIIYRSSNPSDNRTASIQIIV